MSFQRLPQGLLPPTPTDLLTQVVASATYFHRTLCHSIIATSKLYYWASWMAQLVENLSTMQETPVQFLGREDPLEKG